MPGQQDRQGSIKVRAPLEETKVRTNATHTKPPATIDRLFP
jgi:hypothetical protein